MRLWRIPPFGDYESLHEKDPVRVARNNQKMKLPFSEVISEKVLRRLVKDDWSSVFEIASILEMPV